MLLTEIKDLKTIIQDNNKKYSYRKSVGKNCKKLKNFLEKYEYKYIDDTKLKLKSHNIFLRNELSESQENEDTSASKFSKELNLSEKIEDESPSLNLITKENSFGFLVKEKKIFKNLQTNHSTHKVIAKKKENKIKKEKRFSIIPKEEIYDENKKYDFLLKIKAKGLSYLGGCCYMNATLQCFYHIKELTYYFLDNKKEIKRKNGILSQGYLDLVEGLSNFNKDKNYYIPRKFKDSLLEIDDSFRGSELFLYTIQQELGGDSDFPDLSIDQGI